MQVVRSHTAAAVILALAVATGGASRAAPTHAAPAGLFEADLSADPSVSNGEPSVAVNPRNPRNIVATYLLNSFFGVPNAYTQTVPGSRLVDQPLQGCNLAVTFDGGRTWATSRLPVS